MTVTPPLLSSSSFQLPTENSPASLVRTEDGALREIDAIQLNFYGIKLDVPTSYIRVSS